MENTQRNNLIKNRDIVDIECGKQNRKYAMTGTTWGIIKQYYPELIPKVVSKGVVFARMSGEQKQQLIEELQSLGYYVGKYTYLIHSHNTGFYPDV